MQGITYFMDGDPNIIEAGVAATLLTKVKENRGSLVFESGQTTKGYKRRKVKLSELNELYTIHGSPDVLTGNSYVSSVGLRTIPQGVMDLDIRRVELKTRDITLLFSDAKKLVKPFKASDPCCAKCVQDDRKEWLKKVEKARAVQEEYLEYVPLTEAEKSQLFG